MQVPSIGSIIALTVLGLILAVVFVVAAAHIAGDILTVLVVIMVLLFLAAVAKVFGVY